MARFPRTEAEILALAEAMETGLAENTATYPSPPVTSTDLNTLRLVYTDRKNLLIAAQAAAELAVADKDEKLEDLIDGLKSDIRYAENTVDYDDAKLKLIGWAGRSAAVALQPPGQARLLEAPKQGEGWVYLDWKKPDSGGKPAAYKIMRRNRPDGAWEEAATAVVTEATLVDQTRGAELEYRIIAVNKAGEGEPSNTAMVVL